MKENKRRFLVENKGYAIIELSLSNKKKRAILGSQADMKLSGSTFEIFKREIYFITNETINDIWLAEGLQ